MKKRFVLDQSGEGYIDVALVILIIFVFMASIISLFPIFTTQQSLNETARYLARTVELTGMADDDTLQSVTEDGNFIIPDSIAVETEWENASRKTIQLKTPFVVTITKTMPIIIMRPALGDPFAINVRIFATAHGISEVYFKK